MFTIHLTKKNMKTIKILILTACLGTATSCSYSFSQKWRTTKSMEIANSEIHQHPLIADLIVQDSKSMGTATSLKDVSLENLKQEAIADALKKTSSDVLIEPRFETEITNSRNMVSSTLR